MRHSNQTRVLSLGVSFLAACGGREAESPVAAGPPQDVRYKALTTPQFAKSYIDKPVRTAGAFLMMPPQMGLQGKYSSGWVSLTFSDAEPGANNEYTCQMGGGMAPNLAMMGAGGVSTMAPTDVGQEFLSAKTGSVYELVGVLRENKTTHGGYSQMFFEISSAKVLAVCKLASGGEGFFQA